MFGSTKEHTDECDVKEDVEEGEVTCKEYDVKRDKCTVECKDDVVPSETVQDKCVQYSLSEEFPPLVIVPPPSYEWKEMATVAINLVTQ